MITFLQKLCNLVNNHYSDIIKFKIVDPPFEFDDMNL